MAASSCVDEISPAGSSLPELIFFPLARRSSDWLSKPVFFRKAKIDVSEFEPEREPIMTE